ncbi:MAG: globin domain-containing protein [Ilumatobacteraceae bacterium]
MDQINLVQRTFAEVIPVADQFSIVFYDRLFELEPTVRSMFTSDLAGQREKLVDELTFIVDHLGQMPSLIERTTELGRRHVDSGVQPRHYDLVLDSTLFALRSVLGERMTAEVETAWRRGYNLAAEMMMMGASASASAVIDYD